MAAEHPKKKHAYFLFVENGLDAKAISDMLGVSENTISKWNKAEDWKGQRTRRMLAPDKLISHYYEQSEVIIQTAKDENRPLTSSEADALVKLASAISKLDKKVDVSITTSVLRRFNNYLLQIDLELSKAFIPHEKGYVQMLIDAQK
jgi:transposase